MNRKKKKVKEEKNQIVEKLRGLNLKVELSPGEKAAFIRMRAAREAAEADTFTLPA